MSKIKSLFTTTSTFKFIFYFFCFLLFLWETFLTFPFGFFCRMPAWTHETGLTVKRYGEWGGVLFFIISLGNVSNVSPWFFCRMDTKPDRSKRCDWLGVSVTFRRFGYVSVFRKRFVISEMFRDRTWNPKQFRNSEIVSGGTINHHHQGAQPHLHY